MKPNLLPKSALPLIVGILIGCSLSLQAATRAKEDNEDNLNLASSWTNNIAPGSADVALIDGTVGGPSTVALGANLSWNQLNFADPNGDFLITAGNTLTLSNNTPITFSFGTANLTLDCDLVCAGTGFATLASAPPGRTVTFGGAIRGRSATVTLGNSSGTMRLSSTNTTMIGTNVQVTTAGLKLGIGASSIGFPFVLSGPLGTNLFIWGASATTNELFTYNGAQELRNNLRISSGPLVFNSAFDLTFSGLIDLNSGNRAVLVTNGGVLRFTGTIANGTGLTKTGPGTLELGGTNIASATFSAGLSIFGGKVRLITNDVLPDISTAGTLRMTNTTDVFDLNGFSEVVRGVSGSGGSGSWNGTLDNTASNTISTFTLGDSFTYTMAGNIQNSGLNSKLALVKVGAGGLILTNAKSFSGGITNASAGELFINSPGAAGTGPIVFTATNAELVYSGSGTLTLTNDLVLAAPAVLSTVDGTTLTVSGVISGPGLLNRTNTLFQQGLLHFAGDNTFTGGFSLFGGAVMFSHPRAAGLGLLSIGNSTSSGGSIAILSGVALTTSSALTNSIVVNRDFTIGGTNAMEFAGPIIWITNATQRSINVTNLAGMKISGPMSGYGFNKTGQGLLTFDGVCSHNGPSTVSVGPMAIGPNGDFTGATTILVGSSASFDVSAVSGFAIKPTQALRANGGCKVAGHVTINGALTNNTTFGTATFSNNLTLATGSTTAITINRFSQPGTNILCLGTLTFGGNLIVDNFGDPLMAGDTFKLFGFTGNPGAFATILLPTLDPGLDWNTTNLSVDGTITVVSTSSPPPQLSNPQLVDGTNFVLTVTGGVTNGQFRVLTQTNVAEPMANWSALATNTYDGTGSLTITNPVNSAEPQRYFRIVQP